MTSAGLGVRSLEGLIDLLVCFAILYGVAAITGHTTSDDGSIGFEMWGVPAVAGYVLCFAYYVVLEAMLGATIGKLVTKLRVVRERDGAPIDWRAAVIRNLFRLIDGFLLYLVGFLTICFSSKRQRFGDMVAGTIVVRRAAQAAPLAQTHA
ncbi:MAG: RDD family protein [Stellaceae bacterium]